RLTIVSQDGDAIPRLLPAPHGGITGFFDCSDRKFGVCRLQFLQAGNVRSGSAQPVQEIGEPLFDVIYAESSDFHLRTKPLRMASTFRPAQPPAGQQVRSLVIFISLEGGRVHFGTISRTRVRPLSAQSGQTVPGPKTQQCMSTLKT